MLRRIRTAAAALVGAALLVPLAAPPATAAAPKKLWILVTNDDGVSAPGIDAVVRALRKLPNVKVTVVAPLSNQSGTGDQTTPGELAVAESATASGITARAVDGFPADTVIWALDHGVKPKLVVSGVNTGQNLGPVVDASGTVGAAKTAVRHGVPALAVSQGLAATPDATPDYAAGVRYAIDWVKAHRKSLTGKHPKLELENLNVPTCPTGKVRGLEEVPGAATGDINPPVDCASTLENPTDDLQAFANGFATVNVVPVT